MPVSFKEAFFYWLKLGFINFGGPTGQIAIMHGDLVEKRKWISEDRFLHALNYCMLLPGPEAMQLATYIGWLMHGTLGGIIAGIFFVLPSIAILILLSWIYAAYGQIPAVVGIFGGIQPVVIAIVAFATYRIGTRALKSQAHAAIAFAAFVAIFFLQIPFPLIILGAGALGLALPRAEKPSAQPSDAIQRPSNPADLSGKRIVTLVGVFIFLWAIPLSALIAWRGVNQVFVDEYFFFTQAAFVTFGGAYAVLAYIAQVAVFQFQWLDPAQMIDGLALAETTPGPLIMVLQFVGFMGAWKFRAGLDPVFAGTLGALVTTYATFLPSFFFIFLGAPYIEKLRGNSNLNAALSSITAAVVGVILNLAVVLGARVIFPHGDLDVFATALALFALLGLWKLKWEIVAVVLGGGALGLVRTYVGF